jgi:hypothetical protein
VSASLAASNVVDARCAAGYRLAMRAVLVADGATIGEVVDGIASALRARGYVCMSLAPDRTFDREVRDADLIVVGFRPAGLIGGRVPAATRSFIDRLPPVAETPAAVFCVGGRRAERPMAAATDGLAVRGALVLIARRFGRDAAAGTRPFVDSFLEAVAERRGS